MLKLPGKIFPIDNCNICAVVQQVAINCLHCQKSSELAKVAKRKQNKQTNKQAKYKHTNWQRLQAAKKFQKLKVTRMA